MRFTKMHGAGNDYIYVNCFEEKVKNPAAAAVNLSDRHFGVGGDGLALIMPSRRATPLGSFIDDIESLDLDKIGLFENHSLFLERVNTEFVKIEGGMLRMRVWERGSGEILACGTGACASLATASLNGLSPQKLKVVLRGGELFIDWQDDNCVYMTGPAKVVFTGEVEL